MSSLLNFSKPASLAKARDPFLGAMDQYFSDFFENRLMPTFQNGESGFFPSVDVETKEDQVHVHAELAGLSEKDVDIHLDSNRLVIDGHKTITRSEKSHHYTERRSGKFHREIQLPFEVDREKIAASLKNGVLSIEMCRAPEAKEKMRRITVKS